MSTNPAKAQSEINLSIEGIDPLELYGENDAKLKIIKKVFPKVKIVTRGTHIKIEGDKKDTQLVKSKIEMMITMLKENHDLSTQAVEDLLNGSNHLETRMADVPANNVIVYAKDGRPIKAKTVNQKKLVELSAINDILFAIGPAGTGKTYTAVALAVAALKSRVVKKIILTRPAVEAGESLGFLPGDLKEKVDPYLRPLYDALEDMLPMDKLKFFMEQNTIEVAPLAFMRGRTLDNAFIILDEAQNCTSPQIKMFLTRLGPSAKCIITGDLTQIDLPPSQSSGLYRALHLLSHVDGIGTIYLSEEDVVRHRLVKEIIKRYNESDVKIREEKEKQREEKEREREEKERMRQERIGNLEKDDLV